MFPFLRKAKPINQNGEYLIEARSVVKTFKTAAGPFTALKDVNLRVNRGEFVAIIGKSGSGKSTLLNMLTGIDRPTAGEVYVGDTAVHTLSEGQLANWRGKQLGIVFQFFQLLPTLTLVENVMLPMDFCGLYSARERKKRAMELLELVEMADQAQQAALGRLGRTAAARGDRPRPGQRSAHPRRRRADRQPRFEDGRVGLRSVRGAGRQGKTIVMVTHDADLAKRVDRAVIVSDGEVIDEYLARTFPALTERSADRGDARHPAAATRTGQRSSARGTPADKFFIVTRGQAEVVLKGPDGSDIVVARMKPGQYFGEIELRHGGANIATIRAAAARGCGRGRARSGDVRSAGGRIAGDTRSDRSHRGRAHRRARSRRARSALGRRPRHEDRYPQNPARSVAQQRPHAAGGVEHLHRRVRGRHHQRHERSAARAHVEQLQRQRIPRTSVILLNGAVDDDDINSLARLPGVAGIEGSTSLGAQLAADARRAVAQWPRCHAHDYEQQKFNTIELLSGAWPTKDTRRRRYHCGRQSSVCPRRARSRC